MPKESFVLKTFTKGLISDKEARDLENDSVYLSDGFSFSHSGALKLLGDGWTPFLADAVLTEAFGSYATSKQRLISFRYDYDLGLSSGSEFASTDSAQGYKGTPKFIEGGVTYYIVASGDDGNEVCIVGHYKTSNGTDNFQLVGDAATFNSAIENSAAYPPSGNPLIHDDLNISGGSNQPMRVGPDNDADIVGYFVDGGFRYCDANFSNTNNNIVGYIGHIKRTFLSELTNVKLPEVGDEERDSAHVDMSFTRNHWHFCDYTSTQKWNSNAHLQITQEEKIKMENTTRGFRSWVGGVFPASVDGHVQWRHSPGGQALLNYKMWCGLFPNLDQEDSSGNPTWSTTNASDTSLVTDTEADDYGDPVSNADNFQFKGTMDDGHDLRRRWILGCSTLYDGDPQGICQETGIQPSVYNSTETRTDVDTGYITSYKTYEPWIYDFKRKQGNWDVGSKLPYTYLEQSDDDGTGGLPSSGLGGNISSVADNDPVITFTTHAAHGLSIDDRVEISSSTHYNSHDDATEFGYFKVDAVPTTTTFTIKEFSNNNGTFEFVSTDTGTWREVKYLRWGNYDAFPKITLNWTFQPWWAESSAIAPSTWTSDKNGTWKYPLYDARTTGFRFYIQDADDAEKKWNHVATIDATRGVVRYDGCSMEEHAWLPRGRFASGVNEPYRLEDKVAGDVEVTQEIVGTWSNMTTGRTNVSPRHKGNIMFLRTITDMNDDTTFNAVGSNIDPYDDSKCSSSVNLESIPDFTYELLNGYKPRYSPTSVFKYYDSFLGTEIGDPTVQIDANDVQTKTPIVRNINEVQQTYGDVYRFKAATILNDRVYIGNTYNTRTGKVNPDRILKTEPGQYDIFPDDGFHHIDLATGDGDSIVHMETYFGKLYVWKHNALYVIAIDTDGLESIEATHFHYGIEDKNDVVLTKHGPVWFNEGGVYLSDMEGKMHNLIQDRLARGNYIQNYAFYENLDIADGLSLEEFLSYGAPGADVGLLYGIMNDMWSNIPVIMDMNNDENFDIYDVIQYLVFFYGSYEDFFITDIYINQVKFGWKGFVGSTGTGGKPSPVIGYHETDDKIIICKTSGVGGFNKCNGDAYIFDFFTKNWAYGRYMFPYGGGNYKSNFVNDIDGNLIYLHTYVDEVEGTIAKKFNIWDDMPGGYLQSKHTVQLVTKDIDFESPGVRKKVYKIYFTVSGNVQPNVHVLYAINGSKKFQQLNQFTGKQNYSIAHGFLPPYGEGTSGENWYTAILKPSSGGESLNNIYSIQLMILGRNQIESMYSDTGVYTPYSTPGGAPSMNWRPGMPGSSPDSLPDAWEGMDSTNKKDGFWTPIDHEMSTNNPDPWYRIWYPPVDEEPEFHTNYVDTVKQLGEFNPTESIKTPPPIPHPSPHPNLEASEEWTWDNQNTTLYDVHKDFQINDITIIYRAKNAR